MLTYNYFIIRSLRCRKSDRFAVRPLRCRTHINLTTKISLTANEANWTKIRAAPYKNIKKSRIIFYPNNSLITQMTITIMTKATTTYSAIKPIVSNMSNIRKSVANIQHTRHIRSAIAAMLITYDKHPLIIVWFSIYKLTRNLFKTIFVNSNCQFLSIRGYLLFWAHRNATSLHWWAKTKKDVFATIGITKYINPQIYSEVFFMFCATSLTNW